MLFRQLVLSSLWLAKSTGGAEWPYQNFGIHNSSS